MTKAIQMTFMLHRPLIVLAVIFTFYTQSMAADEVGQLQSNAMRTCYDEAGQMKGDARKAFMVKCLGSHQSSVQLSQDVSVEALCASPDTGPQFVACSAAKLKEAEFSLNAVYRELRTTLKRIGAVGLDESLVIAQRDWVRFRQTHCNFDGSYEGAFGSIVSAKIGFCMTTETQARTKYLNDILKYFPN